MNFLVEGGLEIFEGLLKEYVIIILLVVELLVVV